MVLLGDAAGLLEVVGPLALDQGVLAVGLGHLQRGPGAVVGQADVERVAREAVQTVGLEAETRRVGISLDIPPGLPAVTLDPALLKQCLVNLLRNAVEALPHGGFVTVPIDPKLGLVLVFMVQNAGWRNDDGKKIQPEFTKAAVATFGK